MAKGLIGPVSVVTLLLLEQLGSQLAERVGWVNQLVKLLFVGALGSFHAAVELGGAWWQHKKPQPLLLTGGLKLGPELRATVHLDRLHRTRHTLDDRIEEVARRAGGSAAVDTQDVPAADNITRREVLVGMGNTGLAHVGAVHLNQISRRLDDVVFGLTHGIGPHLRPRDDARVLQTRRPQFALASEPAEDAAHHRDRDSDPLASEDRL